METFSPKQYSDRQQYVRDVLAMKPETTSALLSVGLSGHDSVFRGRAYREALAHQLREQYGVDCAALMTSRTIVLRAPTGETPKILSHLKCPDIIGARLAETTVPVLPKPRKILSLKKDMLEHVAMLNAYEAHNTTMGEQCVVAIVDTGVDYDHPRLQQNFGEDKGYDFVKRSRHPRDDHGHGTHVAGIVQSVAPGVTLKSMRVLNENGAGSEADILLAYEQCYKEKIPIINCSLGSQFGSQEEQQVVQAASSFGCLIVAAAGNESEDEHSPNVPGYPAWWPGVQSVASVSSERKHSRFSNMGKVEFAALGEDVFSTVPGGYATMTGTSMASPCVAGAFALQYAARNDSLDQRLLQAASECQTDFGQGYREKQWRRRFGFGIPDCARWVR